MAEQTGQREITSVSIITDLADTDYVIVSDGIDVKKILKKDLIKELGTANKVTFTPTGTIESTNVQGAITEVKGKVDALGSPVTYKGTVATYAKLPTTHNVGDMYNVTADETTHTANMNYCWNGTAWDSLGATTDMNLYYTKTQTDTAISNTVNAQNTINGELAGNFATAYSPSATYALGAYCTYQNVLYKCTTAITTPEAWNSAHWIAIPAMDEIAPLVYPNAGSHNSVFRGKDITANVTDGSFYTNIKNGTFKDIYIGDYFKKTVNGTVFVFRVAGLDVYLHRGDTEFTSHHAVIVPDGIFGKFQMNSSNTTAGGYVGSAMYTSVLPTWAGYLATAFGSNLLTNRELLSNAIIGDNPSSWAWYNSKINLLTSEETVGHGGFGMSGYNYGYNIGIAYGQLPLFRLAPEFICNREIWWLRNVTAAASFAYVSNDGHLSDGDASGAWGLRPRFLLG